jgi:hypothetical protein
LFLCPNCHGLTETFKGKNIIINKNKICIGCGSINYNEDNYRCDSCISLLNKPSFDELIELLNEKMTIINIGKKYNVSKNTVNNWIKFYNSNEDEVKEDYVSEANGATHPPGCKIDSK